MQDVKPLSLVDVFRAQNRIKGSAVHTPLRYSQELSGRVGKEVWLKLENMQPTGSFKLRGAANKILSLSPEALKAGVITVSSGNHGRAVAYMAGKHGISATVCMTEIAPKEKIKKIEELGARVLIGGDNQDVATDNAMQLAREQGLTFVPPFDDPHVIAGQGTIGLEVLQDNPDIDTLIVQVSGGGLMSGVALAARAIKPDIKIIGVCSEEGAAIYESIKAGKLITVGEPVSIADALPGPIPLDNKYTFNMCRDLVDEIVPVSDDDIKKAMVFSLMHERMILEGGGAAGIALLQNLPKESLGDKVAVVCSGSSVDPERVLQLASQPEFS